ncbi:hypothetical protein QWY96_15585 [Vibrio artabrorum]|uniref:YtpI-like protein n=1 Tax=Vibrio artabrorum TaxID=446374 RepID=A0ABT8CJP3_9VIBR|nr:hypothetical protein [Vibrio artabrorum]MDN3701957.1 hypothetical protein [Vibrio artabrorum]
MSIFSYALSLGASLFTLMTIVNYKAYPKTLYRVLFRSRLNFVAGIGVWLSIVATFCLISYFSLFGSVAGIFVLLGSMKCLKGIFAIEEFDEEEVEERLSRIES